MKIDQLTYFLETAKQEHLGKAARILRLSPSAISHSIRMLEEELGYTLFEKIGRSIVLTEKGRRLKKRIPELLNLMDDIKNEISTPNQLLKGHYRLGGSHLLASRLIVPAWCKTKEGNPDLFAEILSLRSSQILSDVLDGKLDLGLCFSPTVHPNLVYRDIIKGNLVVFLKKDHPLSEKKDFDIKDLNQFPAIMPKAFQGIDVCVDHKVFSNHGIKLNLEFGYDSYETAANYLVHSDAWSLMPDWIETQNFNDLKRVKLPKTWRAPFSISYVWQKNKHFDLVMDKIIENTI
jgi:DNA-binding transcriptional LysR family regulator